MSKQLSGDGTWFHRGKEARAAGWPRDVIDGRMSPSNRAAYAAGWDEQNELMRPRTPEDIAAANARIARLKAEVTRALETPAVS